MDMARYAGRPEMDWQFHVLNSDQVNAFAVPGGYIYITRGLLFRLRNEAQLASVLGHESGHIAHRDTVQQIQRAQGFNIAAGLVGLFGGQQAQDIASFVSTFAQLSYSRDQEKNADMAGLKYMSQAGYNPQGMVQVMQILEQAQGANGGPPEFLSTHPDPGNRVQYLTDTINSQYHAAAASGVFDASQFRQNVLARQRQSLGLLDADQLEIPNTHVRAAEAAPSAAAPPTSATPPPSSASRGG